MHTVFLVTVGMACALTSWVHRARVKTIADLVKDRSQLLIEVLNVEERERGALAEALHDNALQSVLAARQDIEDARVVDQPAHGWTGPSAPSPTPPARCAPSSRSCIPRCWSTSGWPVLCGPPPTPPVSAAG
ncbi:hypothetical protein SSP24_78850 [Streptomyces spinoverrucosus]|uniref:Uncharacterized protein n=1 Tax=Streptomyces spinoverrucosus TaxID=284043 RepID=A0A4Y3VX50_9ACTN|nr:hypothetical protein [Streptomyces spinoverrucosus]GEC10230.1 hypothetical protein SSP24_78850 [Streptomyces spinoverrucosus]GHB96332.1 hypothetical protein GCM10010397_81230 [Streptomyces spinoverrucosus]